MSRSVAREVALRQLYAQEHGGECTYLAALQAREEEDDKNKKPNANDKEFAQDIVLGIQRNKNSIDPYIIEQARGWSIDRISAIERIILRMAIYEMKFLEGIPVSASINEAVTLAKRYGADERAGAYVNGILGSVARREGDPPAPLESEEDILVVEEEIAIVEEEIVDDTVEAEAMAIIEKVMQEIGKEKEDSCE